MKGKWMQWSDGETLLMQSRERKEEEETAKSGATRVEPRVPADSHSSSGSSTRGARKAGKGSRDSTDCLTRDAS